VNLSLAGIIDDDKNKEGKELFGYRIQSPGAIPSMQPDAILITSITDGHRMIERLKKMVDLRKIGIEQL